MFALRRQKQVAGFVFLAALSGCSFVNPAGLIAASQLDPLSTAPSDITVGVGVPNTVQLANGDAEFRMLFRVDPSKSDAVVDETVRLEVGQAAPDPRISSAPDEVVYEARFSPENANRIAKAQSKIKALSESGIEGQGSIAISVIGGCFVGDRPEVLAFSTWLKVTPNGSFVPLTRQADLRDALGRDAGAALLDNLTGCREAP